MKSISSYRDLKVWQKAIDLTVSIYRHTRSFPKEERYGLVSQIRRAASSIPANIAEGHARRTTGEYLNSLSVAQGSQAELETFLILSERLQLLSKKESESLLEDCDEISKMLNGLSKSLQNRP